MPSRRLVRNGLWMAAAAYAAWGLLSPVGKILLEDFGPLSLNAVRMAMGTLLLMPFVSREQWAAGLAYLRRPKIVALVVLGNGVDFTLFQYALTYMDATYTTLGFYTAPMWTALLAWWFLQERPGGWFVPALALLSIGGWLALGTAGAGSFHWFGFTLAVAAGLGWGIYAVGLRAVAPGLRLRPLMVCSFVAATLYFIVVGWIVEGAPDLVSVPLSAWGWMVAYVVFPTVTALWLFNASLQRAPAAYVNILVGIELAATAVFAAWLLGDRFSAIQVAGLVLAVGSVSGYLWYRARAEPAAEAESG